MSELLAEIRAAILLSRMPGIGAAAFLELMKRFSSPSLALEHRNSISEIAKPSISREKSSTESAIDQTIAALRAQEINGFYCTGDGYPQQLLDLTEPPPVLFSTSAVIPEKFAAVIGSRQPCAHAIEIARAIIPQLGAAGYSILSGGATGIDSVALEAALKNGLNAFAVLGCGLDICYPAKNRRLFNDLKNNGGLISELLCTAKPQKSFFPTRNRIIAGLADMVVLIQAHEKIGSLTTVRWAKKLNRRLLVKKAPDGNDLNWRGGEDLIKGGAENFNERLSL
jgi:DNA processing protein